MAKKKPQETEIDTPGVWRNGEWSPDENGSQFLTGLVKADKEPRSEAEREAAVAKRGYVTKPPTFTLKQVETALYQALGNVSICATLLQCERQTVYNYIDRYPDRLSGIREKCRKDFVDIAEGHQIVATRAGKEWAVRDTLRAFGKMIGYNVEGQVVPTNATQNNITVNFIAPEDDRKRTNGTTERADAETIRERVRSITGQGNGHDE